MHAICTAAVHVHTVPDPDYSYWATDAGSAFRLASLEPSNMAVARHISNEPSDNPSTANYGFLSVSVNK
jgi:hypothetical protein